MISVFCAVLLFAGAEAVRVECLLVDGTGCVSNGPIHFTYTGVGSGISPCNKQYQMTINPLYYTGYVGFSCWFSTSIPYQYIYSVSHSTTATTPTTSSAYLMTWNGDVYKYPESTANPPYSQNFWYHENPHHATSYSTVHYRFRDDQITMSSSIGYYLYGHPGMFTPSYQFTRIGLNRLYATPVWSGSGLCNVTCTLDQNYYYRTRGRNRISRSKSVGPPIKPSGFDSDVGVKPLPSIFADSSK